MDDVNEIMALDRRLVERRRPYEAQWQEIAERTQPDQAIFTTQYTPGSKRTQKMFDSTAALALPRYAAAIDDMVTPRTKRYHSLRTGIAALDEKQNVKIFCESLTKLLFAARYAPNSNFGTQANACYQSSGAYGEGVLFIDDMLGSGLRYRTCHLSEIYIARDFSGIVDLVHRKFKYSARQAAQRFGAENLPECVQKALSVEPMKEFNFIHCVGPNPKWAKGRKGEWKFYSTYVCTDDAKIVRSGGGYNTFPYAFASGIYVPGEDYSRGVLSLVLPDIKQLNEMEKTMLRQAQLAVDPPILLSEDGSLTGFAMQPGSLMWGGLNEDGEELAKPFMKGGQLAIGFDMAEQKRKVINDACLLTLFQILVDKPQMTATEAMFRAQEKGALMAPDGGRKQSEFIGNIVPRELEILGMAGELPPLPPEMLEAGLDYSNLHIEYVNSPLMLAQQADEGVAISRTLELNGLVAQYDPSVTALVKGGVAFRRFAEINGAPSDMIVSVEEEQQIKAQQAQQEQINQLLAAAPVAAQSAKDFSQAQALAAASPASQAPLVVPQG